MVLGPGIIVASVSDSAGKPIAGALLVADGPTEREAKSSGAGIITLNALPLGIYGLRVTRNGYQPMGTSVRLGSRLEGPKFVSIRLQATSFADLRQPTRVVTTANEPDPLAAHALEPLPATELTATLGPGAGVSIDGTSAAESRVELDGLPIAGGAAGFAAVRFRDGLALDRIAEDEAPYFDGTSLRDAIGGIVNYRTPDIAQSASTQAEIGHDSAFGSFEHVRFSDTFGPLGVLADAVTGDGENRSQTAKIQAALAPGTTVGISAYGSQSAASDATTAFTSLAPAYAADLRTKLGGATFEARAFDSTSDTSILESGATSFGEDARVDGFQLGFDIPAGNDAFALSFDRRRESATFTTGNAYDQTFSTLGAHTDFALGTAGRLELGGALSSGTQLAARIDPDARLTLHPTGMMTVRLAAGSSFATAPDAVLAAGSGPDLRAPETSFGYRASVEAPLHGRQTIWGAAYELRRFDRFESLADARSLGAQAGYEAPAAPGGFGASAFVELAKTYAYGPAQPLARYANVDPLVPLAELEGDPYSKARAALTYRSKLGFSLEAGSTLLGAGNALANHAVVLGDASLRVSFGKIGTVALGVSNAFGTGVTNPLLAPLYAPRELTLTIGH